MLADDNDTQGPAIGQPVFEDTVLSSEWLTVTVAISDTLNGNHGVDSARLYYSYMVPYTQTQVVGWGPGGSGDGMWTFVIPPQGTEREGETLRFSLQAIDGDLSPVSTNNDNEGDYFAVTIVSPAEQHNIYLPLITRDH